MSSGWGFEALCACSKRHDCLLLFNDYLGPILHEMVVFEGDHKLMSRL